MRKLLALSVLVLCLSAVSLAQSVTGTWKGKIQMDRAEMIKSLPRDANAEQRKQMEGMVDMMISQLGRVDLELRMNQNRSWRLVTKNIPRGPATQSQSANNQETAEGTWTQSNRTLTLTQTKANGKDVPKDAKDTVKKLTLSADGKTLTLVENNGGMTVKIVFTR